MKPTLPEEREQDEISADVSERYRAGAQDEPSAKLDAAIQAAARREVGRPRLRRNWQVPASIAAMLVIGVSLVLIVRDNEPSLSSLERPAADEAKLAKSAPPQLAMKAQPMPRSDFHREGRPTRERTARPDREPAARDEMANAATSGAMTQAAPPPASISAPATPAVAELAKPAEVEQSRIAGSSDSAPEKKAKGLADAAKEAGPSALTLRKQEASAPARPREWLDEIDGLLREGKEADARRQLVDFRRQYPHYPLPERLQALLPPEAGK